MSNAYQCDRCKGFFAPRDMEEDEVFTTFKNVYNQTFAHYECNKPFHLITDEHLCPACSKKFYEFMNFAKNSTP